jgi:repressor LexA
MAETDPKTSLGEMIRAERRRAGLTQEALAAAIGCGKSHLSLMESDERTDSLDRARMIEHALGITDGRIAAAVQWRAMSPDMRLRVQSAESSSRRIAARLKHALTSSDPLDELRSLVAQTAANIDGPLPLGRQIPVINKVAAGYPKEFTDLDYPASVADDYIACPDVSDPDAFAARVVGDSMLPEYREGEIVVFSPEAPTPDGADCFVRLERDNETTFKRVYFEEDGSVIRLQPLNSAYPPRVVDREDVAGMYAAVYVMRRIGR